MGQKALKLKVRARPAQREAFDPAELAGGQPGFWIQAERYLAEGRRRRPLQTPEAIQLELGL